MPDADDRTHIVDSTTVLITGGSRGLGLALACEFHQRGANVVVCGRSRSDLDKIQTKCPGLTTIEADVTVPEDRERLILSSFRGTEGGLDILVNNAAINRAHDYSNSFTLMANRAEGEIQTNLVAPIELTRLFLRARQPPRLNPSAGVIVNVNTPGALFPLDAAPLYSATKAGLRMFTLALRRQLSGSGVRVCDIYPPALDTGLTRDLSVAGQAANGDRAIEEVARQSVEGIMAGLEVILPYGTQSVFERFAPALDEPMLDMINAGVIRRQGWDSIAE